MAEKEKINYIDIAKDILSNEISALKAVEKSFNEEFEKAVDFIYTTTGRIFVSGIGKSGQIGCKIASVFSSVGISSSFIHPVEAIHGDFGSLRQNDLLILLSNSGNTKELQALHDFGKYHGLRTISITGNKNSWLSTNCDANIVYDIGQEAISGFPVPTSSCIATLAIADAMTACLMKKRHFTQDEYLVYHPGGSIGERLKEK